MDTDAFLKTLGFEGNFDELTIQERETFYAMLHSVRQSELTTEKLKEYINQMKMQVEEELTKHDLGKTQDIYLKARLRNYILLGAFLEGPDRAKKALESALKNVKR
jgi:ribosomal protein L12E/L44/L45/RPP1/RPP2